MLPGAHSVPETSNKKLVIVVYINKYAYHENMNYTKKEIWIKKNFSCPCHTAIFKCNHKTIILIICVYIFNISDHNFRFMILRYWRNSHNPDVEHYPSLSQNQLKIWNMLIKAEIKNIWHQFDGSLKDPI